MADVSSKPIQPLQGLSSGITNSLTAMNESNSQAQNNGFLDLMLARITAVNNDDDQVKNIIKDYNIRDNAAARSGEIESLKQMRGVEENNNADETNNIRFNELKDKVKARIHDVISQDRTPVKDTRAQKLLKKTAEVLLHANDKGSIKLPKELKEKLEAFVAKDVENIPAGEIALLMIDLIQTFKTMNVALHADKNNGQDVWPAEITDALKELGLNQAVEAGKPINTFQALRVLKALVNLSENMAGDTLNAKKEDLLSAIDPEHVLFGIPQENNVQTNPVAQSNNTTTDLATYPVVDQAAQPAIAETMIDEALNTLTAESPIVAKATSGAVSNSVASENVNVAATSNLEVKKPRDIQSATIKEADEDVESVSSKTTVKTGKAILNDDVSAPLAKAVDSQARNDKQNNPAVPNFAASAPLDNAGNKQIKNNNPVTFAPIETVNNVSANKGLTNALAVHADIAPVSLNALPQHANRMGNSLAATIAQHANLPPSQATQQVMVTIQNKMNAGNTHMSLNLTPVELGRVDIRLTISREGNTSAIIIVDRPETLNLLQKDSVHLERALQHAGLNTSQENMSFSLREQRHAHQGFGQNRKRSLHDASDDLNIKEMTVNVMNDGQVFSNNKINYHA